MGSDALQFFLCVPASALSLCFLSTYDIGAGCYVLYADINYPWRLRSSTAGARHLVEAELSRAKVLANAISCAGMSLPVYAPADSPICVPSPLACTFAPLSFRLHPRSQLCLRSRRGCCFRRYLHYLHRPRCHPCYRPSLSLIGTLALAVNLPSLHPFLLHPLPSPLLSSLPPSHFLFPHAHRPRPHDSSFPNSYPTQSPRPQRSPSPKPMASPLAPALIIFSPCPLTRAHSGPSN